MSADEDAVEVEDGSAPSRANGNDPAAADATDSAPAVELDPDTPDSETLAEGFSESALGDSDPVVDVGAEALVAGQDDEQATGYAPPVTYDEAGEPDGPFMRDELETDQSEPTSFDDAFAPPEMAQMLFVEVALMLPATHPVVVLQEADSPFRELRIPVGGAEGIAIAYGARGIETPRPLTHELFTHVLEEFAMTLESVTITEVHGTSFNAEIVISGPLGSRTIDCRPSDAVALALRQRLPVPIMAAPLVLAIAGTDPLGAN